MTEKYIVTATGIKDNKPYAILSRVVSGVKDNGDVYQFVDTKTSQREAEQIHIGTVIEYETKRVTSSKQATLNINSKYKED